MKTYDITISIVLYKNKSKELLDLIELIAKQNLIIKLYLIDNSPNVDLNLSKLNRQVEYIHTNKNLGYGKGQNIGLSRVGSISKYHIFLSSDIKINFDFFIQAFDFMEKYKKVNICVPKILDYSGNLQFSIKLVPNPLDLSLRLISKYLRFKSGYEIQRKYDSNIFMRVPVASGALVILRNIENYKNFYFDPRYFLYMEDVDWCRNVNEKYEIIYNPRLIIKHLHVAGSKKNLRLFVSHVTSAIKYFNKWGWTFDKTKSKENKYLQTIDKKDYR